MCVYNRDSFFSIRLSAQQLCMCMNRYVIGGRCNACNFRLQPPHCGRSTAGICEHRCSGCMIPVFGDSGGTGENQKSGADHSCHVVLDS